MNPIEASLYGHNARQMFDTPSGNAGEVVPGRLKALWYKAIDILVPLRCFTNAITDNFRRQGRFAAA